MEWIGIQCDLHRKGITCFHSVCASRPFNLDTKPLFLVSLDTNPKELLLSGDIETNPGPTHYKTFKVSYKKKRVFKDQRCIK